MQHRPEIDGLRAIAVVPVMFFHAGIAFFPGGYVGVDVFFVISGYLITNLILQDLETGRFSLTNFYQRRARRILPALFFITLITFPAAYFWLPPADMEDYAQSILAILLFVSNFLFSLESGYFETATELKPLMHTWSLAVEEQFYLLYPLILMLLWQYGLKNIYIALAVVAGSSLVLADQLIPYAPDAAFYLIPTRAWELLLGAFTAFAIKNQSNNYINPVLANSMASVGLVLIVGAVLFFDETIPVPGIPLLIPTLGTSLIILYADQAPFISKVLQHRLLVTIGLISYSAYLWHQPLLSFAHHIFLDGPTFTLKIAIILVTFPLAYCTWKYIEQPFRKPLVIGSRRAGLLAVAAVFSLYTIGIYGTSNLGLQQRFSEVEELLASYYDPEVDGQFDNSVCALVGDFEYAEFENCLNTIEGRHAVLFGDSIAGALSHELRIQLQDQGITLVSFHANSCLPIPELSEFPPNPSMYCNEFKRRVEQALPNLDAEFIVLAANWNAFFEKIDLRNPENSRLGRGRFVATNSDYSEEIDTNISLHIQRVLQEMHLENPVVILGPIPVAEWNVVRRIEALLMRNYRNIELSTSHSAYELRSQPFLQLSSVLDSEIKFVHPEKIVCSQQIDDRCDLLRNGKSLYKDSMHPSATFSRLISIALIEQVLVDVD
ncbi:MAG: acyltransferase family protein [Pseudomonadales bacterium]|nr:acyltransferase family protein [Pseudomonadales bacterium]